MIDNFVTLCINSCSFEHVGIMQCSNNARLVMLACVIAQNARLLMNYFRCGIYVQYINHICIYPLVKCKHRNGIVIRVYLGIASAFDDSFSLLMYYDWFTELQTVIVYGRNRCPLQG